MATLPALEITSLAKTYSTGVTALRGVDLSVPAGDFFALLGPNGAGKSTLINIVSGLVKKSAGDVRINGLSIDGDHQAAKIHLGIVPQEFNFGIFERVIDIVLDQAGYYGIPRKVALPRAKELLSALGLGDRPEMQARFLSGGMKRRLMIARALVHNPALLILDEPTAGVDIELRREMWDFLEKLNRDNGVTIILTTHYLEEAEQLCRNVAIINRGEIVAQGEIRSLLAQMNEETFVLELQHELSNEAREQLNVFRPHTQGQSLEVTVSREHSLQEAFASLVALKVPVVTLRNKSNRLEEFFLQKIRSDES